MKKLITIIISAFLVFGLFNTTQAYARGMMGRPIANQNTSPSPDSATAQDEVAGKAIYDKLQSKQVTCQDLTDDDFDVLGDYYMGQRLGNTSTHEAMNTMMTNMMGEAGEKQMHIALGKRLSECDTSAQLPSQGSNFLPMMGLGGMMNGAVGSYWSGNAGSMMGFNTPYSLLGSAISVLVIIFLVLGIIYFWKGINRKKNK